MHTVLLSTLLFAPGSFEPLADIDGPPGAPGYPEGIVVLPHFGSGYTHDVYTSEGATFDLLGETPRVTHYEANLFTQTLDAVDHCELPTAFGGISGMASFADGDLLVLDVVNGGVRLDPADCSQSNFLDPLPNLPSCEVAASPCSPVPAFLDLPGLPNDVVFAPLGAIGFVSDSLQGVVWRFEFGGGEMEPWLIDERLFPVFTGPTPPGFPPAFGPNGLRLFGGDLYIVVTFPAGKVYRVPAWIETPEADDLEEVFDYGFDVGPDNIAFGLNGRAYVTLAGANAVSVLNVNEGTESARYASDVLDGPAGLTFWGTHVLGVNHAILTPLPEANFGVWSMTTNTIGYPVYASFAPG